MSNYLISPRSQTSISDSKSLQESLIDKDKQISQLHSTIHKLQLKTKQAQSYEEMLIDSENRAADFENQIFGLNQKLRHKSYEYEELERKWKEKSKNNDALNHKGDYVRKEDYERISAQLRKIKQGRDIVEIDQVRKEMHDKLNYGQQQFQMLWAQKQQLLRVINSKNHQIVTLRSTVPSYQGHDGTERLDVQQLENQLNRLHLQLQGREIQKNEYKSRAQYLEHQLQQYVHTSSQWSTHDKNVESLNLIRQYEEHIQSMASKLSSIHTLEMQKNQLEKSQQKYMIQCQSLQAQRDSLKRYVDHLQQRLHKIQQYGSHYLQIDMRKFQLGNQNFMNQLEVLFKRLEERGDDIQQLKNRILNINSLFTEQRLISMTNLLNSIEESLTETKQKLVRQQQNVFKEEEKYFRLQKQYKKKQVQYNEIKSELGKLNRIISQKIQKIQFQSIQIKRLENQNVQKTELSEKCAKLQKKVKGLQTNIQQQIDQNNQLLMAMIISGAQIQRLSSQDKVSQQLIDQIQNLNNKAKMNEDYAENIEERIKKLQHLHKCVFQQSTKVSLHLHASHTRWNHYDIAMNQITQFLERVSESSQKTYQEIDENIQQNIKRHDKVIAEIRQKDAFEQRKLNEQKDKEERKAIESSMVIRYNQDQKTLRKSAFLSKSDVSIEDTERSRDGEKNNGYHR